MPFTSPYPQTLPVKLQEVAVAGFGEQIGRGPYWYYHVPADDEKEDCAGFGPWITDQPSLSDVRAKKRKGCYVQIGAIK